MPSGQRPNILLILTDQQHAGMLRCAGNKYLKTPAMDSLARAGARFERAYCANPVCEPSRFSLMTGLMPSTIGLRFNQDVPSNKDAPKLKVPATILERSLGRLFRNAGYDAAYGGKVHLPMSLEEIGFDYISKEIGMGLADDGADFIRRKREKPFLLVASFINPHDICMMAINDCARSQGEKVYAGRSAQNLAEAMRLPANISPEEFFRKLCPPLPSNHEIPALEAEVIETNARRELPSRVYVRRHWGDEDWRLHRWAYARLTERVDAEIGKLLQALRAAGLEKNTLIVFTSDHGDMDSAHRLEHKCVLYEEATRIPFIVSFKGVTKPGLVDKEHLVSNGLNLTPTLCDYAGIALPSGLPGRSVRPLAEGRKPRSWRDQLVVESEIGRSLRSLRYKYSIYDSGKHREQLIDLDKDPGEMKNLAENPTYQAALEQHRQMLRQWVEETHDEPAAPYVVR